jgi:hypothetical protein
MSQSIRYRHVHVSQLGRRSSATASSHRIVGFEWDLRRSAATTKPKISTPALATSRLLRAISLVATMMYLGVHGPQQLPWLECVRAWTTTASRTQQRNGRNNRKGSARPKWRPFGIFQTFGHIYRAIDIGRCGAGGVISFCRAAPPAITNPQDSFVVPFDAASRSTPLQWPVSRMCDSLFRPGVQGLTKEVAGGATSLLSKRKQCNRERVFDIGAVQSALDDNKPVPCPCPLPEEDFNQGESVQQFRDVDELNKTFILFLGYDGAVSDRNLRLPRHATRIPFLLDQIMLLYVRPSPPDWRRLARLWLSFYLIFLVRSSFRLSIPSCGGTVGMREHSTTPQQHQWHASLYVGAG